MKNIILNGADEGLARGRAMLCAALVAKEEQAARQEEPPKPDGDNGFLGQGGLKMADTKENSGEGDQWDVATDGYRIKWLEKAGIPRSYTEMHKKKWAELPRMTQQDLLKAINPPGSVPYPKDIFDNSRGLDRGIAKYGKGE